MKIAFLLMALLMLPVAAIATVSIASNVSLPVLTSEMQTVLFDVDPNDVQPSGDPVEGGGKGPT